MNEEIKEILDKMKNFIQEPIEIKMYGISLLNYEVKQLLDYITDLQQAIEKTNKLLSITNDEVLSYTNACIDLQQELERYKHYSKTTGIEELMVENERLKAICEKASECIKKDTRWFDSEYASIYGELCDCAGAKENRLEVMVNPSNALNILQNGGDE